LEQFAASGPDSRGIILIPIPAAAYIRVRSETEYSVKSKQLISHVARAMSSNILMCLVIEMVKKQI